VRSVHTFNVIDDFNRISYILADASGELKHGPLALIDADIPVVLVAPNNVLLEKLRSNKEEVHARGGQLYVFADKSAHFEAGERLKLIGWSISITW
jgi:glucosamine--fructose-6-phosphate aminotransferase (isomerizing)